MKRERNLLLAPYLVLIPVVIAMYYALAEFVFKSRIPLFDVRSPLVFCLLVAVCLLVLVAWSLIVDIKTIGKGGNSQRESVVSGNDLTRVILFVIGMIAYLLLLPRLHFQISTMILVAVTAFLLNDADKPIFKGLKAVAFAVILIPAIYWIFYKVFAVILP